MNFVTDRSLEIIRKALNRLDLPENGTGHIAPHHMGALRDLIEHFDYYVVIGVGETQEVAGVVLKEDGHFYFMNARKAGDDSCFIRLDDYLSDYTDLTQIHWLLEDVRAKWMEEYWQAKST